MIRQASIFLWVALLPSLWGQTTGTIAGTVRDHSGAVVPAARIAATHEGTNQTRTVLSDGAGQYLIPLLPVGSYSVRVDKDGFASFVQNGVIMEANTTVQVDAALQVRAGSEQVTVNAVAAMVQANSATLVQVMDTQRVSDLPLNGRNVLQLVSLTAGVADRNVPVTYQGVNLGGISSSNLYLNTVAINGSRGTATNYLLDNADNNEAQTNLARPFPNVDAVEEFSIQTSSFDAQYGRGVGGVINVVTKSGTNSVHGTAFEFLRNFKLNAGNFFSGRDTLKRNQFGGALGGPLRKDRTFFFASYQGTTIRSSTPGALRTAPDAAMKSGNFAAWLSANGIGALHDPAAPATYFPNNQIPVSRFDPVSAKLLSLTPTSTNSAYQVRFGTPQSTTDDHQGVVRADHSFSGRHRVSGRYFVLYYNNAPTIIPTNLLYATDGQVGYHHAVAANDTFTLSPKWVNSLTVSHVTTSPQRIVQHEVPVSLQDLGARVINAPTANLLSVTINGWSGYSMGNAADNQTSSFELADGVGYATGRHNLRFGGEVRLYRTGFNSFFQTDGASGFTGQYLSDAGRQNAGNAYAEFLLGRMASFRQTSISRLHAINNVFSLYAQDDFRVTGRLTLNLGVRWDPKPGLQERDHQLTTFIPGQQSTVFPGAPRGLVFYGDQGVEDGPFHSYWKSVAPRFGLAYQLAPRTVLRSAYGIFYDEFFGLMLNRTIQAQPWIDDATLTGPLQFSSPFGSAKPLDPSNYKADRSVVLRPFSTYAVPSPYLRPGYTQNWNFVLEREALSNLLLRAAYVGSKGTDLLNTVENNPGIFGPGATAANINQRRPYANIGPLPLGFSNANSSYNSLQVTAQKRYSHGFSVLGNFTWAKSIDTGSFASVEGNQAGPDPFNTRNNRGPSNFDVTKRLVVSGIWEMPKLGTANRVVKNVLGGWQSNAIFTAATGTPLTVVSGVNNSLNGVAGDFADYRGGEWRISGDRSRQQQIAQWFDKSVFAVNAVGTIGSGRRGQLRAPGLWNVDYSLFKSIALRERARLQLRGEFFNFFNHANLDAPNVTVNSPAFGLISGASSPRIVQVAAKVIF
jgi:outer membrane receptor protein involved in Fe transport